MSAFLFMFHHFTVFVLLCTVSSLIATSPVATVTSLPSLITSTISPDATTASATVTSAAFSAPSQAESSLTTTCTSMTTTTCTPTPTCTSTPSSGLSWTSTADKPISYPIVIAAGVILIFLLAFVGRCLCCLCPTRDEHAPGDEELLQCWADYGEGRLFLANQYGMTNTLYRGYTVEIPPGWWLLREPGSRREMRACWRRIHGD